MQLQRIVPRVTVSDVVRRYVVALVRATRTNEAVELGASPRGSLALYQGAQALAALRGRAFRVARRCQRTGTGCSGTPADAAAGSAPAGPLGAYGRAIDRRNGSRSGGIGLRIFLL